MGYANDNLPPNPCYGTAEPCFTGCTYRPRFWMCPKWISWAAEVRECEEREDISDD